MKQLQFNRDNFRYLETENEKLHELVQELTARLTILNNDILNSGTRGAGSSNTRSKGGTSGATRGKGKEA